MKPLILTVLLAILPTIGFAGETIVGFNKCEFRVKFPTSDLSEKMVLVEGVRTKVVSTGIDYMPHLRAECMPATKEFRRRAIDALEATLMNQARGGGVKSPQISTEKVNFYGKDDYHGTYRGELIRGGFKMVIFGKIIIGQKSILNFVTIELEKNSPSDEVIKFLSDFQVYR